ncbi:hypothetical protein KR222_004542, partial [Zaprionus bogoriensis]
PMEFVKLTKKQLSEYDGKQRSDGRILIAFKRVIYDVSQGLDEFGPQGSLACVAGGNLSDYLEHAIQPIESRQDFIERWEMLLNKNYMVVGILASENVYTESEQQDDKQVEDVAENNKNKTNTKSKNKSKDKENDDDDDDADDDADDDDDEDDEGDDDDEDVDEDDDIINISDDTINISDD